MATIDSLDLKATPLGTDTIELNDGKKATLASLPVPSLAAKIDLSDAATQTALESKYSSGIIGGQVFPRSASTVSGTAPSILSAAPTLRNVQKPFHLIAPGFEYFTDDYTCTRDGYSSVLPTIANGYASYAVSGYILGVTPATPKTSFHAVQIDVVARAASGSKLESVGMCKTGSEFTDWLICYYDGTAIKVESKVGGTGTTYTGATVSLTTYKLALAQTQNIVSALYDVGNGWVLAGSWDVSGSRDFTAVDLTTWKYCFYLGGTGAVRLDNFRCGFFGETGLSSFYEITYEDGTPIWEGRNKFFAVAVAGLDTSSGGAGYKTAHTAVYKYNVDSFKLECVAKILTSRSSKILGDSYGPIIFDRGANLWRFFPQGTGTFTSGNDAYLFSITSKASLLSGVHILTASTVLPLAANGVDPFWDLSIRKIGATWYAAYSSQYPDFRPTLDTATSIDGTWTRVNRDTTRTREGARIVDWFGTNYILHANDTVIDVYSMALVHQGTISITSAGWSFSTPSSHPMLFPVPQPDGTTKYQWITHSSGASARPFTGWTSCYGSTLTLNIVGSRTGFVVSPDIK